VDDLLAALCLMAVLEGLLLFALPAAWKRTVAELIQLPDGRLRIAGAVMVAIGLIALSIVRS
jgi:uncharacterized protein YjeT (DUF2065 family)